MHSPSQLITTIPAAPRVVVFAHSLVLFVLLAGLTSPAAAGLGTTGTSANPVAGNDAHGNLTTVLDAAGGTTHFTYDSHGNKLTFTNANGKTTSYTYSSANRLVSATDPLGMTETWSYDAGGRMLTHTEAAGNVKSLTYDSLSRVTMVSFVQGAMAQQASSVAFAYDRNGNRT